MAESLWLHFNCTFRNVEMFAFIAFAACGEEYENDCDYEVFILSLESFFSAEGVSKRLHSHPRDGDKKSQMEGKEFGRVFEAWQVAGTRAVSLT